MEEGKAGSRSMNEKMGGEEHSNTAIRVRLSDVLKFLRQGGRCYEKLDVLH